MTAAFKYLVKCSVLFSCRGQQPVAKNRRPIKSSRSAKPVCAVRGEGKKDWKGKEKEKEKVEER